MISIIICSRSEFSLKEVSENIISTIGVPFEIIGIDNSKNEYSICSAYNKGAKISKFDVLCFMHEDLHFNTNNWGQQIVELLKDNSIGAIGVAGGKWHINAPISWWGCGNKYVSINIHEDDKKGYNKTTYSNPEQKALVDVVGLDGLWICSRKEIWKKYSFDENTFTEFHFYDVDYCANMFHEYRVCVTYDINITHFSQGSINDSWFINADKFYRKHVQKLPFGRVLATPKEAQIREYEVNKYFILEIIKRGLPASIGIRYLLNCIKVYPFNRNTIWLCMRYSKFLLGFK